MADLPHPSGPPRAPVRARTARERPHGGLPQLPARPEAPPWERALRAMTQSWAAILLLLFLLPSAQAQFVSACGSAPSGINSCPWYHVEVVIFRNDNARHVTAEDLTGDVQPRWSPRLATLLPPVGEDIRPLRIAEYAALWQSAGQAPEWLRVTPGLSVEQERFLLAIEHIGQARHPIDLDFLDALPSWAWQAPEALASEDDSAEPDVDGGDPETAPIPVIEPIVVIAQPLPELTPQLDIIDPPDLSGVIPMDLAFREVPSGQRLLNSEAARLRRARGFEVLGHLAWRQPFIPNAPGLAQLIYSADLAAPGLPQGELLLGTLSIDLRRFLHAHLDLYFKAPDPDAAAEGDRMPQVAQPPQWIHIGQSRRMRSGELHYLDHPWIGAIIRIERFEAEATEP